MIDKAGKQAGLKRVIPLHNPAVFGKRKIGKDKRGNVMQDKGIAQPDNTAVRTALWRALHLEVDSPPHVFEDKLGLKLADPDDGWRSRPDMDKYRTSRARAAIVARARFIEDLVVEQAGNGIGQYVILGAGLDTFAQRRPEIASRLKVFEVDQPGPQAWKRQRLQELGTELPEWLRFVPVDFEAGESWWERLVAAGFNAGQPAVVTSSGVSMYLSRTAILATMRQVAALAPGSTLVMTFVVPLERVEQEELPLRQATEKGARAAGTPWISFFMGPEMVALARESGFREARHVSAANLAERYFRDRGDGVRPSSSEEIVVAST